MGSVVRNKILSIMALGAMVGLLLLPIISSMPALAGGGGPGERHDDLLGRLFGHPLELGHAADGKERDPRRADAVAAGGNGMAELVQDDAGEDRDHEKHAFGGRRRAAAAVMHDADPQKQEQKGQMDADLAAGDAPERQGPLHSEISRLADGGDYRAAGG